MSEERELTEAEEVSVDAIEALADELKAGLDSLPIREAGVEHIAKAKDALSEAVLWATKAITA